MQWFYYKDVYYKDIYITRMFTSVIHVSDKVNATQTANKEFYK